MKAKISFADRMEEALRMHVTAEQAAAAGALLLAQRERAATRCGRSYVLFLGFAAAFTILQTPGVTTITVMGLTLSRAQPVTLLLLLSAAYTLYQSACAAVHGQLIDEALRSYWRERMEPFYKKDVTPLFQFPSALNTENVIAFSLDLPLAKFSRAWVFTMIGALSLLPAAWFIGVTVWLTWKSTFPITIAIVALVLVWILLARCIVLMFQYLHIAISEAFSEGFRSLWGDRPEPKFGDEPNRETSAG
ncbi:MAG: hypothetical protein AABO58_24860 [Acidobacteriota bacterium]